MIGQILVPLFALGGMGAIFGVLLSHASKMFEVVKDERMVQITEVLPGANCGGCGFPGCSNFAAAIVDGNAKPNGCPVGGDECASEIAEIMGVESEKAVRNISKVFCGGCEDLASEKYIYEGIGDCVAAYKLAGGSKTCKYGCLGLGSCVKECKFDAISIVDGIAVINPEKCTCCGMCISTCPKKIIAPIPEHQKVWVACMSRDKGGTVNKYCETGCIGCRKCENVCNFDAIHVLDNLASIDYDNCTACGECVASCPKNTIKMV